MIYLDENLPYMKIHNFDKPQPKAVVHIHSGISDREVLKTVIDKANDSPRHFIIITSDKGFIRDSGWAVLMIDFKIPKNVSIIDLTKRPRAVQQALFGKSKTSVNNLDCDTKIKVARLVFREFMKSKFGV